MVSSIEYPATRAAVKRGLKRIGYSQLQAARATQQSPALVSMILAGKAQSRPCLEKLARLIAEQLTPTLSSNSHAAVLSQRENEKTSSESVPEYDKSRRPATNSRSEAAVARSRR